jgi:hypothetical protein
MKRLGGHQTYFFPYIGFFTVLNAVDIFVYGDLMQYQKQGWMNRNRIIAEDGSIIYINVPVKRASRNTPSNEMLISYAQDWEATIFNHLGYYKKRAPYYKDVEDMLRDLFSRKYEKMCDISIASVDMVLERLGIEKSIYRMSELGITPPRDIKADEWGIYVCKLCAEQGIDTFTNAPGGKQFYDEKKYEANGLKIEFLQNNLRPYDQGLDHFEDSLSIIDVMMFNSPDEIKDMLNDYHVL